MSSSTIDRRNGYGNITYELTRTLGEKGHDVTLLLPYDYAEPLPSLARVRIQKVLPKYLFRALRPELIKYWKWSFDTQGIEYDLVHSLFEVPYAPLMAREAKRLQKPFIMGAQGTYGVKPLEDFPERHLLMYAYNAAKAIIVPSIYTRDAILAHAQKNFDITIIHNGVDFERIRNAQKNPNPIKEKYKDSNILLTVGQLKSRKGQDLVIRALPQILNAHPKTVYLVVGDDGWHGYLEKLAAEVGVRDHVVFTGPVPNDEVTDYFYACDVYVHTARIAEKYYFEGFGIVYLEAGACGKPAVGTDAGGIKDALLHEQTGFVAENEHVDQIASYVTTLLGDEALRSTFGKNALRYAEEHTWDSIADQFLAVYQEVAQKS